MKERRTIDHDGLDGVLQTAKITKTEIEPKKSKLLWLLPVTLIVAAGLILLTNKPNPSVPIATTNPVTASADQKVIPRTPTPSIDTAIATEQVSPNTLDTAKQTTVDAPAISESSTNNLEPNKLSLEANESDQVKQDTDKTINNGNQPILTIYFKFDSTNPVGLQKSERTQLIALAKQCQSQILLTGHTCNSGVDWSNQILGLARANSIKQLLIKNGIPSQRIVTRSEGMLKPVAPNDTKSGQALNRRTEVACIGSV